LKKKHLKLLSWRKIPNIWKTLKLAFEFSLVVKNILTLENFKTCIWIQYRGEKHLDIGELKIEHLDSVSWRKIF
jgi:hypothetical protein